MTNWTDLVSRVIYTRSLLAHTTEGRHAQVNAKRLGESHERVSCLAMLTRWAARRNGILGRMAVTFWSPPIRSGPDRPCLQLYSMREVNLSSPRSARCSISS